MQGAAILLPGMPLCVPHRQEGEAAAWSVIISCIARGRVPHLPQGRHCALLGMDAMHVLASAYSMPTHGWHGGVVARHRCNVHEDVTAAAMWLLLLCCYCHVIATATWFLLPCGATAMLLLPYMQITKKVTLHKKAVDDVLGGEDAWKNVAKTDGTYSCLCVCPPAFHYLPCACSEHDWLHIHTPLSCTYAALRTCSAADSTTPPVSTLNYIHPVPTPLLPASPHLSHFPPLLSLPPPCVRSPVPQVRLPAGVLHGDPDAQRRRARHPVLQVRGVRRAVEGGVRMRAAASFPAHSGAFLRKLEYRFEGRRAGHVVGRSRWQLGGGDSGGGAHGEMCLHLKAVCQAVLELTQ